MRVDYSKSRSEKEAQGTCSHLNMGLVDWHCHTGMILALGPFALGKQNWYHLHLWAGKVKKDEWHRTIYWCDGPLFLIRSHYKQQGICLWCDQIVWSDFYKLFSSNNGNISWFIPHLESGHFSSLYKSYEMPTMQEMETCKNWNTQAMGELVLVPADVI